MDWFFTAVRKYAVFSGRAQRAEFWMYCLIYLLLAVVLGFVDMVAGTYSHDHEIGLFSGALALALLLPSLAVGTRRLHDIGRSGWWQLLWPVPIAGALVLLWFFVRDSQPGDNAYGANPKAQAAQDNWLG
jgi:uncharacterized membrane protein YhaH (DUF805 family)